MSAKHEIDKVVFTVAEEEGQCPVWQWGFSVTWGQVSGCGSQKLVSLILFILKGPVTTQRYMIHNEIPLQPLAPWADLWVWKCRGCKEFSQGIFISLWFCRLFQDKQNRQACNVILPWLLLLSGREFEAQDFKHALILSVYENRGANFLFERFSSSNIKCRTWGCRDVSKNTWRAGLCIYRKN